MGIHMRQHSLIVLCLSLVFVIAGCSDDEGPTENEEVVLSFDGLNGIAIDGDGYQNVILETDDNTGVIGYNEASNLSYANTRLRGTIDGTPVVISISASIAGADPVTPGVKVWQGHYDVNYSVNIEMGGKVYWSTNRVEDNEGHTEFLELGERLVGRFEGTVRENDGDLASIRVVGKFDVENSN